MNLLQYIVIALTAYFVGSIPTAYLLIRNQSGKDLRKEGSGNIGAMNAFEVSRSRKLGVLVLVIDLFKGALVVFVCAIVCARDFPTAGLALVAVVLGHNYSPWLGFKGGRGLATAAGGSLLINPLFVIIWGGCWFIGFSASKNIHVGNILATIVSPFLMAFIPGIARSFACIDHQTHWQITLLAVVLCVVIMIKHVGPLRELLKQGTLSDK